MTKKWRPDWLLQATWTRYVEFHTRGRFKLRAIAIVGLITYPLYYVLWTYVFPQPYESLILRQIGFGLSLAGSLEPYWPKRIARFYLPFSYVSIIYGLPIFFTAMTLLNGANAIWLMSLMASFLFVALLYDIANAIIASLIGSVAGVVVYLIISNGQPLPINYIASIPVFSFTFIGVLTLSYTEQLIAQEKLLAANSLASHIAHEMRTPLAGIRLDCEKISTSLNAIVDEALASRATGLSKVGVRKLSPLDIARMQLALQRVSAHASTANHVIETLLINVARDKIEADEFSLHSLDDVIQLSLDRYPFHDDTRNLVKISGLKAAAFWGSDVLMLHVFFNLLKNGLTAIDAKGSGTIQIDISKAAGRLMIKFEDFGIGISRELVPTIFMPFVTSGRRMQGTGLGLSFCQLVIESFHGTIGCSSVQGQGSTFLISLPEALLQPQSSEPVRELKKSGYLLDS